VLAYMMSRFWRVKQGNVALQRLLSPQTEATVLRLARSERIGRQNTQNGSHPHPRSRFGVIKQKK